jgi:hypothetical protein
MQNIGPKSEHKLQVQFKIAKVKIKVSPRNVPCREEARVKLYIYSFITSTLNEVVANKKVSRNIYIYVVRKNFRYSL